MQNSNKQTVSISSNLLVQPGKSTRLQEMRNKALSPAGLSFAHTESSDYEESLRNLNIPPELIVVRQLIDQKLTEILASFPAGKQKRLFKIRFGIDLDLIRELPIKRVLGLMKIQSPILNNPVANMKKIGDLNYNGELV